jgi:hypothetical protein
MRSCSAALLVVLGIWSICLKGIDLKGHSRSHFEHAESSSTLKLCRNLLKTPIYSPCSPAVFSPSIGQGTFSMVLTSEVGNLPNFE